MIKFLENYRNKKREETQQKVLELKHWITKFFEDLTITKGTVELPACIEARNLMLKLQIDIDNPKIVNFYYKNLQQYKLIHNM